jgi:UDP-N-acetylglucosamine:LPS N-acetylglucosamine transferase
MAKILIFVSKTGGGHVSLGESLRDLLSAKHEIELIDPQPRIVHWHYRTVSRHALWLWELEYRLSDGPRRARLAHTLAQAQAPLIIATIERFKPDMLMTTYPFLADEVVYSMRLWRRAQRPFAMLLSDPGPVHASWLTERNADAVFAPTRETYEQALAAKIAAERLHMTGWPVRGQFYHAQPARDETLARLGLTPGLFTVFMQGGGEGATRLTQTVETLTGIDKIQVILAVGTNHALYERFRGHEKVHALPFTKDIARYMSAADVVMGKAGPNILFESVTLGKPFIATSYIPGQERPNLDFIRRYGLGWVALDQQGQSTLLSYLARDPEQLTAAREAVERYRVWNTQAVQQIPRLVDGLLDKSRKG